MKARIGFEAGLGMVIFILAAACANPAKQSTLMKKLDVRDVTATEIDVRVTQFILYFSGVVEEGADAIIAQTHDRDIRREAYLWKMNAIPAMYEAGFRRDPLAALIDVWAFCEQMDRYFTNGEGSELFGELQPIAVDASGRLLAEIVRIAGIVVSPELYERGREKIAEFAVEHPITSSGFQRESTIALTTLVAGAKRRGGLSVVNIEDGISDIAARLAILNEQLPKQARWQADMILDDVTGDVSIEELLMKTSSLMESLEGTTRLAEDLPEIIDRERQATLDAVHGESMAILDNVNRQRVDTLDRLTEERIAVIAALRQEREALVAELKGAEGILMESVQAATRAALDESTARVEGWIDHAFWRAAQLIAATMAIALVAGFIALRKLGRVG